MTCFLKIPWFFLNFWIKKESFSQTFQAMWIPILYFVFYTFLFRCLYVPDFPSIPGVGQILTELTSLCPVTWELHSWFSGLTDIFRLPETMLNVGSWLTKGFYCSPHWIECHSWPSKRPTSAGSPLWSADRFDPCNGGRGRVPASGRTGTGELVEIIPEAQNKLWYSGC